MLHLLKINLKILIKNKILCQDILNYVYLLVFIITKEQIGYISVGSVDLKMNTNE